MRRRRGRQVRPAAVRAAGMAAGLLLAAGAVMAAPAPATAAVGSIQTGVWWRGQPDGGTLPAPPHVPSGGLWVSSDPSGPSAVSAVRLALGDGDTAPALTLHVAQSSNLPDTPAGTGGPRIMACATPDGWQPTQPGTPGPWSAKPAYDCGKAQAPGIPSADGTTITFDLRGFTDPAASASTVAVALLPVDVANPVTSTAPAPAPGPPGPLAPPAPAPAPPDPTAATSPSTFDVTFNPPQPADVEVTTTPPADSPTAAEGEATAGVMTASGSLSAGASFGAASLTPAAAAPVFTPEPAVSPAPPKAAVPPAVALGPVRRAIRPAVAASGRSTVRVLSGLVFVALAVWAWRLLPQPLQGAGGRPFLTLYDIPGAAPAAATAQRPGLASGPRAGKPPSLR